jgi:Zn-dependent protease with chaperone function
MMLVLLALPLIVSLLVRAARGRDHLQRDPRVTAWCLTVSAVALAASTTAALALLAWPLFARLSLVARVGSWSTGAVSQEVPIPLAVSCLAILILAVVLFRAVRSANKTVAEIITLRRTHRDLLVTRADRVVVADDPTPAAVALPGLRRTGGRMVISTGLLAVLGDDECEAALAHERSHLAHRHHLFAIAVETATALNPMLAPMAARARFALERWADEDAARATDPAVTATALARAALGRIDRTRHMALSSGLKLQIAALRVTDRVAALLDDRPSRRVVPVAVLAASGAALAAVLWAAHDMEHAFEALQALTR